jgi:hypothetical protein
MVIERTLVRGDAFDQGCPPGRARLSLHIFSDPSRVDRIRDCQIFCVWGRLTPMGAIKPLQ